jgi:hypothetical protein
MAGRNGPIGQAHEFHVALRQLFHVLGYQETDASARFEGQRTEIEGDTKRASHFGGPYGSRVSEVNDPAHPTT